MRRRLTASAPPSFDGGFSWERTSVYDIGGAPFLLRVADLTAEHGGGLTAERARSDTDLGSLVADWKILADFRGGGYRVLTVEDGDARVARLAYEADRSVITVDVYSPKGFDDAQAAAFLIVANAEAVAQPEDPDLMSVTYWTLGPWGPQAFRRTLDTAEWADASGNYAASIRGDLDDLHRWTRFPDGGRLILAAGEPGTGKTTLIRTLARAWRGWCDVNYVVDPDDFFGTAAYMTGVLLGEEYADVGVDGTPRSRLIVVEDCDELLTTDAKSRSGEGFSRLLNVCDGLVGQGLRVALYLTTNEPVDTFHPAILRPGRCLATLHIDALAAPEADAWRTAHGLPETGEAASLAALYGEERAATAVRRQADAALTASTAARLVQSARTRLADVTVD